MKKSEMIKLISDHLGEECGLDFLGMSPDDVAKTVLEFIEEKGMLPPSINGVVETEALEDGSIVVYPWKWEPEDEKK